MHPLNSPRGPAEIYILGLKAEQCQDQGCDFIERKFEVEGVGFAERKLDPALPL